MSSPTPFSGAVICYNEEQRIADCLESLAWCDEVIVVDSGSTDRTAEIVDSFPNTHLTFRPFDTFINQKNHALDLCSHDWIISLDADEVLPPALINEIQSTPLTRAGYRISRRSFIGEQEIKFGTWNPDFQLRLFRKSLARWGGTNPHETILLNGETGKLQERMLHFSYDTREQFIERNTKYVRMMVDHLRSRGASARMIDAYTHCFGNFMKAYFIKAGFLDGSVGLFLAKEIAAGSYMKYRMLAGEHKKAA